MIPGFDRTDFVVMTGKPRRLYDIVGLLTSLKSQHRWMLTCRGHPGNHLHMRASVSGFAGFPSEIFTCSRSSNPRFGGSMKQHMNLHLRVPKHIHRPLDLHNYLITILPIPWNPEIWFFIRQGADTRVFANSCGSLKACGQKRTKCNPIKKENIQPFFPQCLKAFGHALALPYPA